MTDIYLGRQPIYDRELRVVGYALICRSEETETGATAPVTAPEVVFEKLVQLGIDKVVGRGKVFLEVTRAFLAERMGDLPRDRFVLSLRAGEPLDAALRASLAAQGHSVMLEHAGDVTTDAADIVRIDATSADAAASAAANGGRRAKRLVQNVETYADYRRLRDLGFDYFAGHFVVEPDTNQDEAVKASRLGSMRLLASLQNPDVEFGELESIIGSDPTLSYKLLRYLNSAFFALPSKLESIKRALLLLGLRPVRNWASMIVLSGFDDKPQELIITAMLRARFCEQLAQSYGHKAADAYFTVGLLSTLDAFLNTPMTEALESIPLTDEVKAALLDRTGDLGEVLQMVLDYERGIVKQRPAAKPLPTSIADIFLDAVAWVTEAAAELIMCNTARQAA